MNMKIGLGEAERFDERNNAGSRARWDPVLLEAGNKYYGKHTFANSPRDLKDWCFAHAAWNLERRFGHASSGGNYGLTRWEISREEIERINRLAAGQKYEVSDADAMSRDVKKVAGFLGASLTGICELDHNWVLSHRFDPTTFEHSPISIPKDFKYAIVMAHEMDYGLVRTSPSRISLGAVAKGYSDMVFVAGLLAHFIRGLGYKAIPSGNDTALSIPLSVDAGLGQLGRNGLLITEKFGPRVRISKVMTDLPLSIDKEIDFGVSEFCATCKRCALSCPSGAISRGEPTSEPINPSNNGGVFKWYVDAEKCFRFWAQNGGACTNCVRVCPFNKPTGLVHALARGMIKYMAVFDPVLVRLDDAFGYGKKTASNTFWE